MSSSTLEEKLPNHQHTSIQLNQDHPLLKAMIFFPNNLLRNYSHIKKKSRNYFCKTPTLFVHISDYAPADWTQVFIHALRTLRWKTLRSMTLDRDIRNCWHKLRILTKSSLTTKHGFLCILISNFLYIAYMQDKPKKF